MTQQTKCIDANCAQKCASISEYCPTHKCRNSKCIKQCYNNTYYCIDHMNCGLKVVNEIRCNGCMNQKQNKSKNN